MSYVSFKVGGALTDDHCTVYVERIADNQALVHLRRMDYLLIIEPRQQGKTSLINYLMRHPGLINVDFAYVDVTTPERSSEASWYQTLCPRILRQLRDLIPCDQWPVLPKNSTGWRDFLWNIAASATDAQRRVVIALDEIGAVTFPGATEFFSVLRDVYNSRQAEPEFKQLTFLLTGAFHPRDLIKDDKVSPFNIAQRVRLPDFTMEQVCALVSKGKWTQEQVSILAERIHYWTDGQPYLTQLLCSYLEPDAAPGDVDAGVERLRREDENHLPPLLERLNDDEKLCEYIRRIQVGKRIKFYPRENRRQVQLELLGVIKADAEGYCTIRNRIYEQVLPSSNNPSPQKPIERKDNKNTMNIPLELTEQLQKGNVVLFCGAGISASKGGLPSGTQLAQELAHRASLGDMSGLPLPDVAQAYELERGHHSLISYLIDRIDSPAYVPLRSHHLIAALPFKRIITTNWDNLLEDAFKQARRPFEKIVRDESVAYASEEKTMLIKLHGSIEQKDTLVVTGDDYYDVFTRLPEIANLVRSYFATKTLLFVGFGLADEDFKRLYHEVVRNLGKHKRRAYAVQLDPNSITVKYWQQKNVEIINADATEFLEALHTQLSEADPPDRPSFSPLSPSPGQSPASDEIIKRLQRIKDKLDQGRVEDRQAAEQMLDALAQNQVAQVEAAQMINDLNTWAQRVQRSGLPLNPELRYALDALTDHTGSAYQYLQLAFPIIPGILSYNVELGSEHQVDLKTLWERIKARFGKGAKGNDTPAETETTYHGIAKSWAVLVGINQYSDPSIAALQVCVDDVTAIHQSIASNYQVAKLLTDATPDRLPTRSNILGELSTVAQTASKDDLLLFYFSGHGKAEGGESYLLARDTRLSALKHTAVSMRDVRELIDLSPAHAKVIVLDACHSGASIGKAEPTMTPEFIRRVFEEAEGMAVLASCKQGQQSWEWREKNRSVFTYYLLEALTGQADWNKKGFVTVSDASQYVTNGVKSWAVEKGVPQTPTLQYTVAGDIILLRYAKGASLDASLPHPISTNHTPDVGKGTPSAKVASELERAKQTDQTPLQMDRTQKRELVNALLACPTMSDQNTRDAVINELPDAIKGGIQRNSSARVDVNNVVTRCLNYVNGIEELVEIVCDYEGSSIPMQGLDEVVRQIRAF
ncbi:MAG: hypothetical protein GY832_35350 [Chloroflexi bacterium]|nr:hypothetical protein [Chloroflexota bacterium]